MIIRALVRRREVWCPTIWGWLTLIFTATAMTAIFARNLGTFLAVTDPVGAHLLVVEGWMDRKGLDQAATAFRMGGYQRIVTTGGPIDWPDPGGPLTFAERSAEYLKGLGLEDGTVTAVPAPYSAQERTFLSAVMVRDWARQSGITLRELDVFSAGTHARRSRLLYRLAFGPKVKVGIMAARATNYDGTRWWRTSTGARDIIDQAIGLLWVECFFWPPSPGSIEERWGPRTDTPRDDVAK
jgi:hypothetical protein